MQRKKNVPVALFDRLGEDSRAASDVRESIREELLRLLNTRRSADAVFPVPTILDYGMPDWTACGSADEAQKRRLAHDIRIAILSYEPRLRDIRVEVDDAGSSAPAFPGSLAFRISASLFFGGTPVSFSVSLQDNQKAKVEHAFLD